MMKKYVFLDRDGTLIFEPQNSYQIDSIDKLLILDGAIDGLKLLLQSGYSLVLVTNQDGLGTKSFPGKDFEKPQKKMLRIFRKNGIAFDIIFICPHFPNENCPCRKPKTGLVEEWLKTAEMDRKKSLVCGDRETDRGFADNLHIPFIQAKTNGEFPIANIRKFIESPA